MPRRLFLCDYGIQISLRMFLIVCLLSKQTSLDLSLPLVVAELRNDAQKFRCFFDPAFRKMTLTVVRPNNSFFRIQKFCLLCVRSRVTRFLTLKIFTPKIACSCKLDICHLCDLVYIGRLGKADVPDSSVFRFSELNARDTKSADNY